MEGKPLRNGILLLLTVTATLWAQPPTPRAEPIPTPPFGLREHVRQQIERWKTLRLLEELGLDENSGNQFLLRYTAYSRRIDSTLRQLDYAAQRLSLALQERSSPEELQRSLTEMLRHQRELLQLMQQRTEALRPLLSEEQFARYILFEYRFPKEVERALWHRYKEKKRKP